jgi:ribonuclease D
VPRPVFDTQIAAMVCGFGESISYVNLVKKVTGVDLDKSSRFTDWSRRPLSEKQLSYALADVTHLRDVYGHLKTEIEASSRAEWLNEEMGVLTDPKTYEQHPDDAWQRLKLRVKNRKALAVLMELAAWRERLAQSQDVPRARILRDEALYDIANQAPTSTDQVSAVLKVAHIPIVVGIDPYGIIPLRQKAVPLPGCAGDRFFNDAVSFKVITKQTCHQ